VIPEPDNQLFIDLDGPVSVDEFCKRFASICSISCCAGLRVPFTEYQTSKSRNGNTHVVVTLCNDRETFASKVAYRAILGSDPYREIHNIRRRILGSPHPVVFFERAK
jgi:hypothetical protein